MASKERTGKAAIFTGVCLAACLAWYGGAMDAGSGEALEAQTDEAATGARGAQSGSESGAENLAASEAADASPSTESKGRTTSPRSNTALPPKGEPLAEFPQILAPFAAEPRAVALRGLLGEGPFASAFLASFLASEKVDALPGGDATRDAIAASFLPLFQTRPAALWRYAKEVTRKGDWAGFERERYLVIASAYEANARSPELKGEALEHLVSLLGEDRGDAFLTGVALVATRLGSVEEAEEMAHALLAGREDPVQRAQVVNLIAAPFPEVARRFSSL